MTDKLVDIRADGMMDRLVAQWPDMSVMTKGAVTTSLTYSSYYELVKDAAFHHDQAWLTAQTKAGPCSQL